MNEKISYIKLPNITTSNLQDVVNFLDDNEIEYVEYYAEDLQNRIDKAIEYIEKLIREEFEVTDEDSIDYGKKFQRAYFSDAELCKIEEILRGESDE